MATMVSRLFHRKEPRPSPLPKGMQARVGRFQGLPTQNDAFRMLALAGIGYAVMARGTLLASATRSPLGAPVVSRAEGRVRPGAAPTFNRDIAPILFQHCAVCHHLGQVAPFPLLRYADVKKRAEQISLVTQSGFMPPWKACEPPSSEFAGGRGLTKEQRACIQEWVQAGAPEGDPADLPATPHFADGWQLGKPDLILTMPKRFRLPASGPDFDRCFVIPQVTMKNRWVRAVEYRPGNPRVVHHAFVFADRTGEARRREKVAGGVGFESMVGHEIMAMGGLGVWSAGAPPHALPEGVARQLRRGVDLVLQIQYHPSGKPEEDRSSIGLYFAQTPPTRTLTAIPLSARDLRIPPGEKRVTLTDDFTLPIDVEAVGVIPHAHLLCKEIEAVAYLPDESKRTLLHIKDWDYSWQEEYRYAKPPLLPAGTRIQVRFTYDNSADNPRNPYSPPRLVTWGEDTHREMAAFHIQVIPRQESELPILLQTTMLRMENGFGMRRRRRLPSRPSPPVGPPSPENRGRPDP